LRLALFASCAPAAPVCGAHLKLPERVLFCR